MARGGAPSPETHSHMPELSWRGLRWDPCWWPSLPPVPLRPLGLSYLPPACVQPLPTTQPFPGSPLICPWPGVAPALSWGEVSLGPAFHP